MAPSQPPADEGPKPPPAPYFYEHVTDDRIESWQDAGKNAVLEAMKQEDHMVLCTLLQELIRSALDGRLDATEAGSVVKDAIAHHSETTGMDVQTLFLNLLALLEDADTRNSNLTSLVAATDIDPEVIRQELDIPLLQALSLVRSSFTQMRTRKTTNILYRQANFNLLREESEGYAKLITEYFNTASRAVHNRDISAESAFERITALVGSFDLDVGRVLDITLDISANLLVRAYGFFVKFYRCSFWWPDSGVLDNVKWEDQGFGAFPRWALPELERPKLDAIAEEERVKAENADLEVLKVSRDVEFWKRVADEDVGMDAFFELGARKITNYDEVLPLLETEVPPEHDARGKEINADRRKRINENRKYTKEFKLLPPPGNPDAAQLLGFKLRFYASEARDGQDVLPENLIFLAALLIKIGFISLRDLYPHLYPEDDNMKDEKERLKKEKAEKEAMERPGGGENALTRAKVLTDDTIAPAVRNLRSEQDRSGGTTPKPEKKEDEAKEELPTPSNQKIMLLKALLLIGVLPEALYILGRFPWLIDADASLPPYLHRIALKMLSKVAETVRPIVGRDSSTAARLELKETATEPDGSVRLKERDAKKITKWLGLDRVDKTDGHTYRHYYPDWDDNIPVCQDIEDVIILCNTFLGYLGVKIGQDAELLGTIVRIAKHSLTLDFSKHNQSRWLDLMKRLIVPALSLGKHNPGLTQEMYELLKFFPTVTRYNIYASWFKGSVSQWPDMRSAFAHNRAEIKDVLRRVTNDTAKQHARALAKVAFSSPGVVVLDMITLLESYSNMIPALVECTRYFSLLGYDVLTWALIYSLRASGQNRMQADGMLTSPWLQALSQFMASLFHRYSVINPSPILQCLASELRAGNTTDLEVFEQVLAEMGGVRSDLEFNDIQLLYMAGGEHLQAQMLSQLADKRFARKPQAQRLIRALADPGLVGQMLIAIAQEKQMYPYHESSQSMPLKVLGNNMDKIQQVFVQYLEVLKTNMKPEEFESVVPDLFRLISNFGLEPRIAFTICRIAILHRMKEHDATTKQELRSKKQERHQENPQTNVDVEMGEGEAKPLTNGHQSGAESEDFAEATAASGSETKSTSQTSNTKAADVEPWHPILRPLIQRLPSVLPKLGDRVSIPFYTTFWTLSLQEVCRTFDLYKKELDKVLDQIDRMNKDRSDMSAVAVKERDRKRKVLLELSESIQEEMKSQVATISKIKNNIRNETKHYFSPVASKEENEVMHLHLLEECFLPRALLSSSDALYSFTMLKMQHDMGTPEFSTVTLLSELMNKQRLASIMFQCTAMEAQNFGRFLCEILKLIQSWHANQATYEKEAYGSSKQLPGFKKRASNEFLDFENFRRLVYNWHSFLNTALQACFESGEYMHVRNGIIVLKSVVQFFPSLNFMGHNMVKHVTALSNDEPRQDLKLAAMSLLGFLRSREKQWVMPQAFRLNDAAKDSAKPGSRAASARPETPQPGADTAKLNASAPAFKPGEADLSNGTRKESTVGKEDGEIEDEKPVASKDGDEVMTDAPEIKATTEATQEQSQNQDAKATPQDGDRGAANNTKETDKVGSKPPTPAPVTSKTPATDSSRTTSTQQPASSRPGHVLPNRPDSRPPNRPLPTPPTERHGGRYATRADDKYGRLDRPNDIRPPSRDHSPRGRRTPERDPYYSSFAAARGAPPPRDDRGPGRPPGAPEPRYPRDDPYASSRRDHPGQQPPHARPPYDTRDRANGPMGPPPAQGAHSDRSAYSGAVSQPNSRAQSSTPQAAQGQDPHRVNPARLALINDDTAPGRDRGRDARDDREPPDPRANAGRATATEPPREPQARNPPPADLAPTGPKRGRLSRDLSAQGTAESSFGRLNGPPQDVPSGPRPPNGPSNRNARGFAPPQAPSTSRPNESPLPSPSTNRPPDSPAALRGPNQRALADSRGPGQQIERQPSSNSVPTTPTSENGPSVHPSRLNQVGVQPPPLQTNVATNGPGSAASPTSAPPSGPRGQGRAPSGPSSAAPPSGPASTMERQRRTDRQRADINATLQGSSAPAPNGQGVNFRGAAQNRQSNAPNSSAASVQPVQALASPMEPPSRRNEPTAGRDEPPANAPAPREELFQGKADRSEDGGRSTGGRAEEGRPDQARGSRNASGTRRPDDEPPQRPPPPGMEDRRDTRGGMREDRRPRDERDRYGAPPVREMRGAERPFRPEDGPPRRPPPQEAGASYPGPPPEWDRTNDRRGPRRDGPDDSRRGGRGGRAEDFRGPRREEERRDVGRMPQRDDGPPQTAGRKRRHEDGPPQFDESKRRRSGR